MHLTQAPLQPYVIHDRYNEETVLEVNGDVASVFNEANKLEFVRQGVNVIRFGDEFNQSINKIVWFRGIEKIIFGNAFNQPIDKVEFPDSLTSIQFGDSFNQPVGKTGLFSRVKFPANLKSIVFGKKFNQPIDSVVWNERLVQISFGEGFNQPIDKVRWNKKLDTVLFDRNYRYSLRSLILNSGVRIIGVGEQIVYDRNYFDDSD